MKNMTPNDYNANTIRKLDQKQHVRKRIGMYLGSNSSEGITTGLREAWDNAVDEALLGYGDTIHVRFYADGSAEVQDYGRGVPVENNRDGVPAVIVALSEIGAGGKFAGDKLSGGLNGVGISAMNAASQRFDATIYRDNKKYEISFKEGEPGFFDAPNNPNSKFVPSTTIKTSPDTRPAAEKKKHPTGTTVRFWPDPTVFVKEAEFLVNDIKARVKATCFLIPHLTGVVEDYRNPDKPEVESYYFNAGIVEMLPTLTHHALVTKPIHLQAETSFTELTNVLQDDGKLKQQEVTRPVEIDVAFAYTNEEETIVNSYVNIIQTKQHGTHVDGMWRALSRTLVNYVKENKFLRAKEEPPTLEDVRDGAVALISIKFPEPTYTGQEKSQLATPQITSLVSQVVGENLKKWLADRKNATQAKLLGTKIVEAKRIREAAKLQKDTARKKTALESAASLPAKLVACSSSDPEIAELWVCEGDSALGGLKQARDSSRVAIYPLRGKPLNTYDTPLSKILANKEWADMIQIIGAGSGRTFEISQVKYKKFVILADSDPDGSHISALVLCGLWKLMPEYIKSGMVYIAMPPLFSITTTGKNKERFYALNEIELDKLVTKLKNSGKKWDKIQRHKGLGEYAPEILDEVVNDPNTRVLKQITVSDVEAFEQVLELAFGQNANDRKDWITETRDLVDEEDLDF